MSEFDEEYAEAFLELLAIHGEQVTYRPRSGAPRTITALVHRDPRMPLEPIADGLSPLWTVEVLSDPDNEDYGGIDPQEVDTGGDRVEVSAAKGTDAAPQSVAKVLPTDGNVTKLELR